MAIKRGDMPFIGIRDGICGYWRLGINVIHKSFRTKGYLSCIKSTLSPPFSGLDADLVACG